VADSHAAKKVRGTRFSVTIPGQSGAAIGWIELPPAGEILRKVGDSGVLLSLAQGSAIRRVPVATNAAVAS
jgi:hypothetical protein